MHAGGCGERGEKEEPNLIIPLQKYPSCGQVDRCTNTQPAPMEEAEPQKVLAQFSGVIEDERLADWENFWKRQYCLGLSGQMNSNRPNLSYSVKWGHYACPASLEMVVVLGEDPVPCIYLQLSCLVI